MRGLLAAIIAVGVALSVTPAAAENGGMTLPPEESTAQMIDMGVHVIGDSITNRVHNTYLAPGKRPPGWTVDAIPGRRLSSMQQPMIPATDDVELAKRHWFQINRTGVATAVLALGTNGFDEELTLDEAVTVYRNGIWRIRHQNIWKPGPKKVVLVTPWRSPDHAEGGLNENGDPWQPYQYAERMALYTQAIKRVRNEVSNVCIMDWAGLISRYPWRLPDGTHPDRRGQEAWRNRIYTAINNC